MNITSIGLHMGATVIRHGGIISPMNGAGTRPTLTPADASRGTCSDVS
jgi:hypothetical protein